MLDLFESASMMPHGYCLLWNERLVALHAGADALVAASYFLIPVAIVKFLRARRDVRLMGIGLLFAAFILLCGLTHTFGLLTLWLPVYELEGLLKLATGAVSAATALVLFPLVPKLIALPSPQELRAVNAELRDEVASHRQTLEQLRAARDDLERQVAERTRDLAEANRRLEIVLRETKHRAKNLLGVVQAIARQTIASTDDKRAMTEALLGRIASLGPALDAATADPSGAADLRDTVEMQLEHYRSSFPGRVAVAGPPVALRAEAAQQIGLATHELATNAVKYGALAGEAGRVTVSWEQDPESGGVTLAWRETGQPAGTHASDSSAPGFGRTLLERAVPAQLGAQHESGFDAEGYRYVLRLPVNVLVTATGDTATGYTETGWIAPGAEPTAPRSGAGDGE